jgi:hypothetical protein
MTTITALQPSSTDSNCSRPPTGRDDAQQFAAFLRQTRLLIDGFTRYLDDRTQPQTMMMHAMIESEHVVRARADNPHPSNPHSPARHLAKQTAGSFFGGFRTPARVPAATSRRAGIRNPAQ